MINFFKSLGALKLFAGSDYAVSALEPQAQLLDWRIETDPSRYQVRSTSWL